MHACVLGLALFTPLSSSTAFAAEIKAAKPLQAPTAASSDWIGFAVSTNGRVFSSNFGTENNARDDALNECEESSQRSCQAIAVKWSADVSILHCNDGSTQGGFLGGSGINRGAANWLARDKASKAGFSNGDCKFIHFY